ncbi:hypothetical protein AB595_02320 [Massilia sp. WF1]|uniref:DUF4214 domain-containing protein n=1 Tax=unclassified Massilia TaxID=2609279 RepID=UPI000649AAA6|nr:MULTISPECIES: DUF4214 domain-containing protein [unclassified Massilia]ALK98766.1 hypothetical protein AM586_23735 [Massilia sp. WG5]KLU38687.1 hypothetical protein AB595_02320 [Massilia sp. WF1]
MADNVSEIQKLYVEYFGRPADPNGLKFWVDAMNQNPDVLSQIAKDFAASAEYQANYGGLSNHDAVMKVYENTFGRAGDTEGVNFWTSALDQHWITIDNMVVQMVAAAAKLQAADNVVFNGRVAVAVEFTKHIDTQAEINAYLNPKAFDIAEGLIGSIHDLASAATARDPGVIDTTIAQIVGTPQGVDAPHAMA